MPKPETVWVSADPVSGHNKEKLIKIDKVGGHEKALFVTARQYTLVKLINCVKYQACTL